MQTEPILIVKTSPTCYNPTSKNSLISKTYAFLGYNINDKLINYHIQISQSPFFRNINYAEVRRLAKCKKSGFRAGLYDEPDIEIVYTFIKESRIAKGYLMSMTFEQLESLINNFPKQCKIFVVKIEGKIIALTVTILVCKGILYNFMPADLATYKSFSPMVYLMETVYNYCQKEEIGILDLGVSLDSNGNEKPGLLKFKKNLGGIKSFKISYQKQLKSLN
ncbi:hypothetical protein [Dyadobacter sp. 3J3]|uniref:hypothetical protein n=1 Tax=Dyadobacter sp. 3J3 TaxID=2606600 RepID=UPI00135A08DB|nr:hypothetical protein [Dyadobacter sp. 3J3]